MSGHAIFSRSLRPRRCSRQTRWPWSSGPSAVKEIGHSTVAAARSYDTRGRKCKHSSYDRAVALRLHAAAVATRRTQIFSCGRVELQGPRRALPLGLAACRELNSQRRVLYLVWRRGDVILDTRVCFLNNSGLCECDEPIWA